MECSQCNRAAVVALDGRYPLCIEHHHMYEQAASTRVRDIMAYKNHLVGQMEVGAGLPPGTLGYREQPAPVIHTGPTINRSVVSVVNTGSIQRLTVALSEIQNRGDGAVADALTKLTEAVQRSQHLGEEAKAQAIEQVSFLAGQAALPPEQRQRGVTRPVLEHLGLALAVAADVVTLWAAVHPLLVKLF